MTVFLCAEIGDLCLCNASAQDQIGGKAYCKGDAQLQSQYGQDLCGRNVRRAHKDGKHFVRGGKEYRKQRTGGHDPSCIQTCQRGGKTALWNQPKSAADGRPGLSGARNGGVQLISCLVLQKFHEQIGEK